MMDWRLRPCQPQDEAFLRRVYAATRAGEIALTGWSAEQAEAFLRMQFDAQHQQYHARNPGAAFDIVELDGEAVGRLYVRREAGRIHVIDIAILPPWRGRGLGGALLRALQAEARQADASLSIYVEINNRAQVLYQRLGFQVISTAGLYRLMEWRATTA
ncbi:GNAT family N-acetyltransferase [Massilia sp. MB5]|uniref:GNAT family N-acetyltransferase n=1 Tax=Massilia sp. MB5 TaxID=2919578 RepID=UPI001F105C6B|nr:GNAT family N-acetyltransferase [Massilia sp. MB5]UMR31044.1 GNAT family N-acetyltransferase [Massilia sp. MB5]